MVRIYDENRSTGLVCSVKRATWPLSYHVEFGRINPVAGIPAGEVCIVMFVIGNPYSLSWKRICILSSSLGKVNFLCTEVYYNKEHPYNTSLLVGDEL